MLCTWCAEQVADASDICYTTFLNERLEEEVYMKYQKVLVRGRECKLKKRIYDLIHIGALL